MAKRRYQGSLATWEGKLRRVMQRLGVSTYDWNADRFGGWVRFQYNGQQYRFEQSIQNARAHGVDLVSGTDAFAQLVLALEDLARMVERGIYDLPTWIAGMRMLPEPPPLPECFRILGFAEMPSSLDAVRQQYRRLAKVMHPDAGGDPAQFLRLTEAAQEAERWMDRHSPNR
ncbi:MAG: J domain-containing protein [Firmicutes bacterium]|nr:J domain-containing protein [Bacillota bacterium]